jgi:hypothetical protein
MARASTKLNEQAPVRFAVPRELRDADIDLPLTTALNDLPGAAQVHRQIELLRKDIDRAQGNHGEPRLLESAFDTVEAIQYFAQCAVATGGHNGFKSLGDGFGRQPRRREGRIGRFEYGVPVKPVPMFQKALGLAPLSDRIVNDADAGHEVSWSRESLGRGQPSRERAVDRRTRSPTASQESLIMIRCLGEGWL